MHTDVKVQRLASMGYPRGDAARTLYDYDLDFDETLETLADKYGSPSSGRALA
jgi:hypothetical protein